MNRLSTKRNTRFSREKGKKHKLVLIGCGGVGSAVLELLPICKLLPSHFAKNLVIIEPRFIEKNPVLKEYKYKHIQQAITKDNVDELLNSVLEKGDIVFDCSVNVDALSIMKVCNEKGCMYANCSMEPWGTDDSWEIDKSREGLYNRSLCSKIHLGKRRFGGNGPSMLADFGFNPGIVSLFALQGIEDMAKFNNDKKALKAISQKKYAKAAKILGIKTIHITEHDTQRLQEKRLRDIFYNTWSAVGLIAESLDPIQMGKGYQENKKPKDALDIRNMRIIPIRGMDKTAWSYSPARNHEGGLFAGYMIPHGEANTLSHFLSQPGYRPSVYFVYQPCPSARASLGEMRKKDYHPPHDDYTHVIPLPELKDGYDAIGALLWSDKYPSWWSGCVLDVKDTIDMGCKYSGPTTIQVAIALISAMKWMLRHSNKGFITPENLPYRQVLRDSVKYLGKIHSEPIPHHIDMKIKNTQLGLSNFLTNKNASMLDHERAKYIH
jgi:homospermidine synthase